MRWPVRGAGYKYGWHGKSERKMYQMLEMHMGMPCGEVRLANISHVFKVEQLSIYFELSG